MSALNPLSWAISSRMLSEGDVVLDDQHDAVALRDRVAVVGHLLFDDELQIVDRRFVLAARAARLERRHVKHSRPPLCRLIGTLERVAVLILVATPI